MIKAHQKTHKGWMRRASRIYLKSANSSKLNKIEAFLQDYRNALNYSIIHFWSSHDFSNRLSPKEETDGVRQRFGLSNAIAQCVMKQAKEAVLSQRKREIKTLPRVASFTANFNSNCFDLEESKKSFDYCLSLKAGVGGILRKSLIIPFNINDHLDSFLKKGWTISKSCRLGKNENGFFIDIVVEKQKPELKKEGRLIGLDTGYRTLLATSDGQLIGSNLKKKIQSFGYRRKTSHHYIETEINRVVKRLNLDNVHAIAMEDLNRVKSNKRGTFSRRVNRFLSFWCYAKVMEKLRQICEESGIRIIYKNPAYTSQRCHSCGNIDRKNRKADKFLCLKCGHQDNADLNASKNLEALGLAEAYSLRSLKNKALGGMTELSL